VHLRPSGTLPPTAILFSPLPPPPPLLPPFPACVISTKESPSHTPTNSPSSTISLPSPPPPSPSAPARRPRFRCFPPPPPAPLLCGGGDCASSLGRAAMPTMPMEDRRRHKKNLKSQCSIVFTIQRHYAIERVLLQNVCQRTRDRPLPAALLSLAAIPHREWAGHSVFIYLFSHLFSHFSQHVETFIE
jgi:hypothetical protein